MVITLCSIELGTYHFWYAVLYSVMDAESLVFTVISPYGNHVGLAYLVRTSIMSGSRFGLILK